MFDGPLESHVHILVINQFFWPDTARNGAVADRCHAGDRSEDPCGDGVVRSIKLWRGGYRLPAASEDCAVGRSAFFKRQDRPRCLICILLRRRGGTGRSGAEAGAGTHADNTPAHFTIGDPAQEAARFAALHLGNGPLSGHCGGSESFEAPVRRNATDR